MKNMEVKARSIFAPLGVWAIVAAFMCLYRYNLAAKSLWYDEAATYQYARLDWSTLWTALHSSDAFYGVYYAAMHCWIAVFGASEIALRTPSILCAALALIPAFHIARRLFTTSTAYCSMIFLGLNPFYYHLAREARVYPLAFFAEMLMTLCLLQAIETNSRKTWAAYSILAISAMYLHLYAVFLLIAHVVILVMRNETRMKMGFFIAAAAAVLCTLPLAKMVIGDTNSQNVWIPHTSFHEIKNLFYAFSGSSWLNRIEIPLAIATFFYLLWQLKRKNDERLKKSLEVIAYWGIVPFGLVLALSLYKPLFVPKYLIYELFPIIVLYSRALTDGKLWRIFAPVSFLILGLNTKLVLADCHDELQSWRAGSSLLMQFARAGDAIAMEPTRGYAVIDYYAPQLNENRRIAIVLPAHFNVWKSESLPTSFDVPLVAQHHSTLWIVLDEIGDLKQSHQPFMTPQLARYYHFAGRVDLTRFSIVKLARGSHDESFAR